MAGKPRKHHYIPQFYLAGFTHNGKKDSKLFVLDMHRKMIRMSNPKNTAHARDFHAINDRAGGDPMAIENTLAVLESKWKSVIATVIENREIPTDESFADLMAFIAFMAMRVPAIRNSLSNFIDRASKAEVFAMLSSQEGRSRFREDLVTLGRPMTDDEFDQLVEFGLGQQYEVDYEQTWHVQQMVRMAIVLIPVLGRRNWRLWRAQDSAPDLICSDRPVTLHWTSEPPGPIPPAFATPNTLLCVPLNKRIALASMLEDCVPDISLDLLGVARVNSMTAHDATQLYSPDPNFVWAVNDGTVGNTDDLLKLVGVSAA